MSQIEGPWYKQFWLWFLLTPLFIIMVAGFFMLYISIVTNDGVVVDNFYKDGKAIIVRHEEDQFAREKHLQANLDWVNETIRLNLTGELLPLPEKLELLIIFPTAKSYDVAVTLKHQGLGQYLGKLETKVSGFRQLQLQPIESVTQWRLHASGNVPPLTSHIDLNPKQE